MELVTTADGFAIVSGDLLLLSHSKDVPAISVGVGVPHIRADRGHFAFAQEILWSAPLSSASIAGNRVMLAIAAGEAALITLTITDSAIHLETADPSLNRLWLDVNADRDEAVWGCGEQMSHLNLRGRNFPLWTSEPGVGRDPAALLEKNAAFSPFVGDYWTTYFPQPTYLSSRGYALHLDSRAYAEFDFSDAERHRLNIWDIPGRIELFRAEEPAGLVPQLARRFGQQPRLPEWATSGAIIGLKDGENSFARLDAMIEAGVKVSAIWCEDWAGIRQTGFGRRLFWDWQRNDNRYPDLAAKISELRARGIGFLGYLNPYLCDDGALYSEAEAAGHFVRNSEHGTYLVDFGEFTCGLIDLTSEAACDWFIDRIIGPELLGIGMCGWMADFGEYLPVDAVLADGSDPMLAHNRWPVLWAELNAKAIARHDNGTAPVFFMRSGHSGVGAHCPLMWAGDQSVDFSRHDGIGTAITAALSAGLVGITNHHSDLGGYTSLGDKIRTPELLMRWAELAAFTPVMRTHEGNRPDENLQIDSSPEILAHFAAMTRLHSALIPYISIVQDEASTRGLPIQRALFLHFPDDPNCRDIQDQYLFGPDLLVVPVIEEGATSRRLYLPPGDDWVHIWSLKSHSGGQWLDIPAPLGEPPVFYRKTSATADVFAALRDMKDLK